MSDFGVIENGTPVYPNPNGYPMPPGVREVHSVAAPPVVVINPPELSNVLHQLLTVLDKMSRTLDSEVWGRSIEGDRGECVEIVTVLERDEHGYASVIEKRKEYR